MGIEIGRSAAIDRGGGQDGIDRALEIRVPVLKHAAHARFGCKWDNLRLRSQTFSRWRAELFCHRADAAAFGSIVAETGLPGGDQGVKSSRTCDGDDLRGQ